MTHSNKAVSTSLPWLALIAAIGIFSFSLLIDLDTMFRDTGIFLSGALPLGLYHYKLVKQRYIHGGKLNLSDAEIDSIYYFGFVITLITLIAAVFTFGIAGDKVIDPQTIGLQFGLGLLATGYALIARLQLQVSNESLSDPEEAYANYVDRVNNLLGRVDAAYTDLDDVITKITERMRTTLLAEASENSERTAKQVELSLNPLFEACNQLAAKIGSQGLGAELENLRAVVGASNRNFKTFETRLQTLSDHAELATDPMKKLGASLGECQKSGAALISVLEKLQIDPSNTKSINESVITISVALESVSFSVQKLDNEFTTKSKETSTAFEKFNENLSQATQLITSSMVQLAGAMAESSKTINASLKEVAADETEK